MRKRLILLSCAVMAWFGLFYGVTRERVKAVAPLGLFYEQLAPYTVTGGFFDGLSFGKNFFVTIEALQKMKDALHGRSIWLGPRMQWAYACEGWPVPPGLPVFWEPGVAFRESDRGFYLKKTIDSKFDVLVTLKGDTSYFDLDEVHALIAGYHPDATNMHPLVVFERNK